MEASDIFLWWSFFLFSLRCTDTSGLNIVLQKGWDQWKENSVILILGAPKKWKVISEFHLHNACLDFHCIKLPHSQLIPPN